MQHMDLSLAADAYEWLGTSEGALAVWGVFIRCFGLAQVVAFISWAINLPALAGPDGLTPSDRQLRAYYRDFGWRAFIFWPTAMWGMLLLPKGWRNSYLRCVAVIGICAGLAVAVGGSWSPSALIVAWICFLSIDNGAAALMFPWDSFILEVTFLTLWLPHTRTLLPTAVTTAWAGVTDAVACSVSAVRCATTSPPVAAALASFAAAIANSVAEVLGSIPLVGSIIAAAVGAATGLVHKSEAAAGAASASSPSSASSFSEAISMVSPPGALLAFMFRYALVRLLVGFGKMKFSGSTWRDRSYIKTFMINQPVASPLAYVAHMTIPDWFWTVSLGIMWLVEIPLPFLAFIPGWPRIIAALGIVALMLGIWAGGNYGFFNLLTGVVAIICFAPSGSVLTDFSWAVDVAASPGTAFFAFLAFVFILPTSLICFIFNSWVNLSWPYWPVLARLRPAWLFSGFVGVVRALARLRIVQAYGVFPPNSAPGQRWCVQFEACEHPSLAPEAEQLAEEVRGGAGAGAGSTSTSTSDREGDGWKPITLPFLNYAMAFVAPYHPRVDQSLFYESGGMNGANYVGMLIHHHPYAWTRASAWNRMQMLLARVLALGLQGKTAAAAQAPDAATLAACAPAAAPDAAATAALLGEDDADAADVPGPGYARELLNRLDYIPSTAELPPFHHLPSPSPRAAASVATGTSSAAGAGARGALLQSPAASSASRKTAATTPSAASAASASAAASSGAQRKEEALGQKHTALPYTVLPPASRPLPEWRYLGPTAAVRASLISMVPRPLPAVLRDVADILSGALTAEEQVRRMMEASRRVAARVGPNQAADEHSAAGEGQGEGEEAGSAESAGDSAHESAAASAAASVAEVRAGLRQRRGVPPLPAVAAPLSPAAAGAGAGAGGRGSSATPVPLASALASDARTGGAVSSSLAETGAAAPTPLAGARVVVFPPPESLSLVTRLRMAAWDYAHCGTHAAPIVAYRAYLAGSGASARIFYIPDEHCAALEAGFPGSSAAQFWPECTHWRRAAIGRTGGAAAVSHLLQKTQASTGAPAPATALAPARGPAGLFLSPADYTLFWRFVGDVRRAAVQAARSRAELLRLYAEAKAHAADADVEASSDEDAAPASAAAAGKPQSASPAAAPGSPAALAHCTAPVAVEDVASATAVLVPPCPDKLQQAADELASTLAGVNSHSHSHAPRDVTGITRSARKASAAAALAAASQSSATAAAGAGAAPSSSAAADAAAAAEEAAASPLPARAANTVFTWAILPAVASSTLARYGPRDVARLRATLNVLALPLIEAAEALFLRTDAPAASGPAATAASSAADEATLAANFRAALLEQQWESLIGAASKPASTGAAGEDAAVAAAAAAAVAAASKPLPTAAVPGSGEAFPVTRFRENDDAVYVAFPQTQGQGQGQGKHVSEWTVQRHAAEAEAGADGEHAVSSSSSDIAEACASLKASSPASAAAAAGVLASGAMRSPARFALAAHWLMLVGGRRVYEKAVQAAAAALAAPASPARDAALLASLIPDLPAQLSPLAVGSESGSFLLGATDYASFALFASRSRMTLMNARPSATPNPPAPLPPFLPGFLELIARFAAHGAAAERMASSAAAAASASSSGGSSGRASPSATAALAREATANPAAILGGGLVTWDHCLANAPLAPLRYPVWGYRPASGEWVLMKRLQA